MLKALKLKTKKTPHLTSPRFAGRGDTKGARQWIPRARIAPLETSERRRSERGAPAIDGGSGWVELGRRDREVTMRLALVALAVLAGCGKSATAPAPQAVASVSVPFVGCARDGQTGPRAAPTGAAKIVTLDARRAPGGWRSTAPAVAACSPRVAGIVPEPTAPAGRRCSSRPSRSPPATCWGRTGRSRRAWRSWSFPAPATPRASSWSPRRSRAGVPGPAGLRQRRHRRGRASRRAISHVRTLTRTASSPIATATRWWNTRARRARRAWGRGRAGSRPAARPMQGAAILAGQTPDLAVTGRCGWGRRCGPSRRRSWGSSRRTIRRRRRRRRPRTPWRRCEASTRGAGQGRRRDGVGPGGFLKSARPARSRPLALGSFYGAMREADRPHRGRVHAGDGSVAVKYRYVYANGKVCVGAGRVQTVERWRDGS